MSQPSEPAGDLDALAVESALLEAAPHPGRSRAAERWAVLRAFLRMADVSAGVLVGALLGDLLALPAGRHLPFAAVTALLWALICFAGGLSARQELRSWASGVPDAARLVAGALVASWALVGLAALFGIHPPLPAALGGLGLALLTAVLRAMARAFVHRLAPLRQRTLIVGSGQVAEQVYATILRHREIGLEPVGIVDDEVHRAGDLELPWLGSFADLPGVLRDFAVDRVIIAFSRSGHEDQLQAIRAARDAGVALDIVPRLFEFLDGAQALDQVGGVPLLSIEVPQLSQASRRAKRALDLLAGSVAVLLLSPVLLGAAAAIKLTSRGPVLFRQPRTGRSGRLFHVYKFRSMYRDAETRKAALGAANEHADGAMFKIRRDPRTTPVGRFIRRTSIDELPQLLNVLRGEMSLVGPRPIIPEEAANLEEAWHLRRLDLRPGITGLWQVSGRSDISFHDMVRLDYQYVAGWSVARDLEILLATLPAVLAGRGAY